jgi:hypothetical protein
MRLTSGLACSPFIFFLYMASFSPSTVRAAQVIATITGTVSTGTDGSGVFGTPNSPLDGQNFTLVFTFDDTQGQQYTYNCDGVPCGSEIYIGNSPNTTMAVLQIGGGSFPFAGLPFADAKRSVAPATNYASFSLSSPGNSNSVGVTVYPPNGTSLTNYSWEAPFFASSLLPNSTGSFEIINTSNAFAFGTLNPMRVAISGPEICQGDTSPGRGLDVRADSEFKTPTSLGVRPTPPRQFLRCSLQITTLALPSATSGQPYSAMFSATGGQGTITWTGTVANSGPLADFTLNAAGLLSSSDTPIATPGNYVITVVAKDSRGQTDSKQFPLTIIPPACAALVKAAVTLSVCDSKGANPCKPPEMHAIFKPNTGSLADAAKACGFLGFNWQQWITTLPSPNPFRASLAPNVPLVAPPPFLDPPPGGYAQATSDAYPFHYDASQLAMLIFDANTLDFIDSPHEPCLPGGNGAGCNGQTADSGSFLGLTTALVGILPDGSPSSPLYSWTWISTYNNISGDIYIVTQ